MRVERVEGGERVGRECRRWAESSATLCAAAARSKREDARMRPAFIVFSRTHALWDETRRRAHGRLLSTRARRSVSLLPLYSHAAPLRPRIDPTEDSRCCAAVNLIRGLQWLHACGAHEMVPSMLCPGLTRRPRRIACRCLICIAKSKCVVVRLCGCCGCCDPSTGAVTAATGCRRAWRCTRWWHGLKMACAGRGSADAPVSADGRRTSPRGIMFVLATGSCWGPWSLYLTESLSRKVELRRMHLLRFF